MPQRAVAASAKNLQVAVSVGDHAWFRETVSAKARPSRPTVVRLSLPDMPNLPERITYGKFYSAIAISYHGAKPPFVLKPISVDDTTILALSAFLVEPA